MVKETIGYLEDLLASPDKILTVIKEELTAIKQKDGDSRLTKVYKEKVDEFSEEDLIPNEPTVITLTTTGYIKRQSTSSFQTQHRGGKGVKGMTTKDEDDIMSIRYAQTHDNILFFTNKGKVYQLRAYEIAESSRTSKGTAIVNLLNIESGERVESFISYAGKIDKQFVFLTTRKGTVKKSAVSEFTNIRRSGIVAIKLETGDELVWSKITTGTSDILLVTREGKAIRFSEKEARPMGRATQGVRGIKIGASDEVIGMDVIESQDTTAELLTIMENGLGKKTAATGFRGQSRGGMGVKVANVTEKTGKVVTAQIIPPDMNSVIITSKKGQVVQLSLSSIPKLSRATQGVILMRFSKAGDLIASQPCVEEN